LHQKYSRAIAIITLTYIATGWIGWFWETFGKQPAISRMPCIRGGRVWGRWGGWKGRVGGLTMLSDTSNQVVCTVGQTDGHSIPDHTTSHTDVQWDRIGPQATLLMHLNGLTGSIMVLRDLTGSKTSYL